ncbi:PTS transporter subunit EIIC [Bacillus taeanensis]|uniref:PTS system mannitol-specific EIICB component n=1 Tax=Bacillus taeanensis TaxID=273032 RepID=A0A366XYM2_9BACI|nr:PTS transporter subunit EIIC [Bacillus taeanensis]RBW69253.1 PTS mannitol transporter subunit IIBC [Bacillus taeanensis]
MRKFGQLLSAMIWQNVAVIIAVGIIRELFGIYGWFYNDRLLLLVNPIYNTLLPILLAYTGGKLMGGQRGAVVASIVTYGLTLASSTSVIFGAMIVGPVIGWIVNKLDSAVKKRLPVGSELLIGNLIGAIVAVFFTSICFLYVGQTLSAGVKWSTALLEDVIYAGWLPLTALIIEPAKVFFFNNIINYGILAPLGIQQAKELSKSIFFLLEANPGPGFGVLLAYWLKTKAEQRRGAKISCFIQFFGGIHEVYFPYILRKPLLLLSVVTGGMIGTITFQLFDVGLVSLPSPGSIFLFIGLAPKEDMLFVLIGVLASALVSFLISFLVLDPFLKSPTEEENREHVTEITRLETVDQLNEEQTGAQWLEEKAYQEPKCNQINQSNFQHIHKILFVCEAGLGSSAVGAAMLRKKLRQANLEIEVDNAGLDEIPEDVNLIICHQKLLSNVQKTAPDRMYYPLQSFTEMKGYDDLIERLKRENN